MAHATLALLILIVLVVGITRLLNAYARPERRLRRHLRRLRRAIVRDLDPAQRAAASPPLRACEAHVEGLIQARAKHQLVVQMSAAAEDLTGQPVGPDAQNRLAEFDRRVAEGLSAALSELARVAMAASLDHPHAVAELRILAEDLDAQRDALMALSRAMGTPNHPHADAAEAAALAAWDAALARAHRAAPQPANTPR